MENNQLKKAEDGLAGLFSKLPAMPENGKKTLVEWFPWISLVFGVLSLLAVLSFWRTAHAVDRLIDYSNAFSRAYGTGTVSNNLGLFFYLTLAVAFVTGLLGVVAFSGLKARSKKKGWNLLFLSQLVSLGAGILGAFSDYRYGAGIIGTLLGAAIGFYLLYQVRSYYK